MLSYLCMALRVAELASLLSLPAGRAPVSCVVQARVIPDIVRSDQGAEMTRKVNEEFLAPCGVRHCGAHTPRRKGPSESNHQVQMTKAT